MHTHNTGWPTTKWGQAQFGRRTIPALAIAIPVGVVIAVGFAILTVWSGLVAGGPLLGGLVFGFAVLFPAIALVYALVVDRSTIAGAVEKPEESIEHGWYQRATSGALTDLVTLAGVLLIVSSFVDPVVVDLRIMLVGLIVFAMIGSGVRYLVARQAD